MALQRRTRSFLRDLNDRLNQWLPTEGDDGSSRSELGLSRWRPKTDVYQEDGETVFEVEAPGLHKDDLNVELDDGFLTISGERRDERSVQEEDRDYYRSERFYGTFQRSFSLPENIDPDEVSAEYSDGVLSVHVPSAARQSGENIEIR